MAYRSTAKWYEWVALHLPVILLISYNLHGLPLFTAIMIQQSMQIVECHASCIYNTYNVVRYSKHRRMGPYSGIWLMQPTGGGNFLYI